MYAFVWVLLVQTEGWNEDFFMVMKKMKKFHITPSIVQVLFVVIEEYIQKMHPW